jgi:hypothetical protein
MRDRQCFPARRDLRLGGDAGAGALPAGAASHFGPELKRFILSQYHQGQVTIPRLFMLLRDLGVSISKRQIVRLLNESQDTFLKEAGEVLRAGLSSASWITVDDTGARHKAKNAYCTHIGNDRFAFFATTLKSRQFPRTAAGGQTDYVINAAALDYMRDLICPR